MFEKLYLDMNIVGKELGREEKIRGEILS